MISSDYKTCTLLHKSVVIKQYYANMVLNALIPTSLALSLIPQYTKKNLAVLNDYVIIKDCIPQKNRFQL